MFDALYHCALSFLQTGVMDSGSNSLQAMPFDILAVLLKLLLPSRFAAFLHIPESMIAKREVLYDHSVVGQPSCSIFVQVWECGNR